jgi:hypothetical protein
MMVVVVLEYDVVQSRLRKRAVGRLFGDRVLTPALLRWFSNLWGEPSNTDEGLHPSFSILSKLLDRTIL